MPASVWNGSWTPVKGVKVWNGSWAPASAGRIRSAGTWVDFLTRIEITDQTISSISNIEAVSMYEINTNGYVYSNIEPTNRGQWCDPVTVTGDYEVRATITFGMLHGFEGTVDTWLPLSSNRRWQVSANELEPDRQTTLLIEIRRTGTTTVLDSAEIELVAYYVPFE